MILWFRWSLSGSADLSGLAHAFLINCYVGWQLDDLGSHVWWLIGCWLRHLCSLPLIFQETVMGLFRWSFQDSMCKRACPDTQVVFKHLFCVILLMFVPLAKANHIANPNSKVGKLSPLLDGEICKVALQNAGRRRIKWLFF